MERARLSAIDNSLSVEFDVIIDERYDRNNIVTEKPVEDGSTISDHVQNTPIITALNGRFSQDPSATLDQLNNFYKNPQLLRYIGRGSITNVVIQSFNTVNDRTNIKGYDFELVLKQINITEGQRTEVVIPQRNNLEFPNRTAAESNRGTIVDSEVDDVITSQLETILKSNPFIRVTATVVDYLKERGWGVANVD